MRISIPQAYRQWLSDLIQMPPHERRRLVQAVLASQRSLREAELARAKAHLACKEAELACKEAELSRTGLKARVSGLLQLLLSLYALESDKPLDEVVSGVCEAAESSGDVSLQPKEGTWETFKRDLRDLLSARPSQPFVSTLSLELALAESMSRFFRTRGAGWHELPSELAHIKTAIERSRALLELRPDDDVPDAHYAEATWTRAVEFLAKNAEWVWNSFGRVLDAPEILPGPKGSIDLDWDYPSYEMLINIPADPTAMAGFYGDDRGQIAIKGTFNPNVFNTGLLLWLGRVN